VLLKHHLVQPAAQMSCLYCTERCMKNTHGTSPGILAKPPINPSVGDEIIYSYQK